MAPVWLYTAQRCHRARGLNVGRSRLRRSARAYKQANARLGAGHGVCHHPGMQVDDREIRHAITGLLQKRHPSATICPSEAARALAPKAWRPLMDQVRAVAVAMAKEGALEIRQGGNVVPLDQALKGPIRLGRMKGTRIAHIEHDQSGGSMKRSTSSPKTTDLQDAPATFPDGPNVAPSAQEHEAARGEVPIDTQPSDAGPDDSVAKPATREERIRQAAYAIAEKRGFSVDRAVDDWLEAERQVDSEPD